MPAVIDRAEQRDRAMERANEVRFRRARFKRDVKAGRDSVVDRLLTVPEWLESAKLFDVLLAQPGWGRARVLAALRHVDIGEGRTIAQLTERQRYELILWLRGFAIPRGRVASVTGARPERIEMGRVTAFERRVLAHVVLEAGAAIDIDAVARALDHPPASVIAAIGSLQRKGLLTPGGRATDDGRARVSVLPNPTVQVPA
jgi:hypothetical protein